MNPIRIMFTLFLAALLLSPAPAPLGAQEAAVEEATDKEVAPDAVEKAEAEAPAETKATTYAVITLSGAIVEVADPIAAAFGESFTTLRQVTDSIDRAAADEEIAGIAIVFKGAGLGVAQAEEIHNHLMAFRTTGKTVLAFQDNAGLGDLIIMSAADRIVMPPVGNVFVVGIQAQLYYLKDMLAKLGIEAQSLQTGRYKSAMEMLTHSEMSEHTRLQFGELIEDIGKTLVESFAQARGIETKEAQELLWSGPYTSQQALKAGIITDLAYREAFMEEFAEENEIDWDDEYMDKGRAKREPVNIFSMLSGVGSKRSGRASAKPTVALVYAIGNIIDGRADGGPFGSAQVIASEDFLDLLDEIIQDGPPRALVVRVDSGGGSAVASDRIWNRLNEIRDEYDIPVVVSMGGVAASGGYYISMGADRIFADATTMTGSIGVIFGSILLEETYHKIGVNKQTIGIGKHVGILDETKRWSGDDLALLEAMRDEVYDTFTRKAAESRGMTQEAILEVAEGRVWTGRRALELGLIDEVGGLNQAIVAARRLAALEPDAAVTIYPKEKTIFELLDELFAGQVSARPVLKSMTGPTVQPWSELAAVLPPEMLRQARTLVTLIQQEPGQAMLLAPTLYEIK
jgi:protease-4